MLLLTPRTEVPNWPHCEPQRLLQAEILKCWRGKPLNLRKKSRGTVLDVLVNLNFIYRNTGFLREDTQGDLSKSEIPIFPILTNLEILK